MDENSKPDDNKNGRTILSTDILSEIQGSKLIWEIQKKIANKQLIGTPNYEEMEREREKSNYVELLLGWIFTESQISKETIIKFNQQKRRVQQIQPASIYLHIRQI